MTTNNQCNRAEAIAKDLYHTYAIAKNLSTHRPMLEYADLSDDDKAGWLAVAHQALPTIAEHAMEDVRSYLTGQAKTSTGWKKALYWAGVGIVGAILGGLGMSLSGCGHSVDMTAEKTVVCKDGSCLVLEPGHLSCFQKQPKTEMPPVIWKIRQGK